MAVVKKNMTKEDYYSWKLPEWFADIDSSKIKLFKIYFDELVRFSSTINLVSTKSLQFADALHFADSINAARMIFTHAPKISTIYDLGSGNGFPGLVIAILYDKVRVIAVDADSRKCEFLKHMTHLLQLKNVEVNCAQIESLPPNSVEYAVTRGFASISKTVYLMRKTVKVGGAVFHLKGDEWGNEVTEIPSQLCSVWFPSLVGEYKLPISQVKFFIVKTEKIT